LFTFDLIQALGMAMNVKWVHEGKLYTGTYCTSQGAIQQLGETGVALVTLTIAIHTMMVVICGRFQRLISAYVVVALIWLFVTLFVSISVAVHTKGSDHYETPTPFWCWIGNGQRYNAERIAGEYFWLWLTLLVSIFTYGPLFFWMRGNITVDPKRWCKVRFHAKKSENPPEATRRSMCMIAYPFVYSIVVLPLSAVRWASGFGSDTHKIPSAATFVVIFLYSLSGVFNAILFLLTRSDLLLLGNTGSGQAPRAVNRLCNPHPTGSGSEPEQRLPLPVQSTEDEGLHLPELESGSEERV